MQLANLSIARFAAANDIRTPLTEVIPEAVDRDGLDPPHAAISVATASAAATRGRN
jgi:hypothetical protein